MARNSDALDARKRVWVLDDRAAEAPLLSPPGAEINAAGGEWCRWNEPRGRSFNALWHGGPDRPRKHTETMLEGPECSDGQLCGQLLCVNITVHHGKANEIY